MDIIDMGCELEQMQRDMAIRRVLSTPAHTPDCVHCEEAPAVRTPKGVMTKYCASCGLEVVGVAL